MMNDDLFTLPSDFSTRGRRTSQRRPARSLLACSQHPSGCGRSACQHGSRSAVCLLQSVEHSTGSSTTRAAACCRDARASHRCANECRANRLSRTYGITWIKLKMKRICSTTRAACITSNRTSSNKIRTRRAIRVSRPRSSRCPTIAHKRPSITWPHLLNSNRNSNNNKPHKTIHCSHVSPNSNNNKNER